MKLRRVQISQFRGFDSFELVPRGHVLAVGEPRAGRSDLLAAISKVFEIDATRVSEIDFHDQDLTQPIEVEVVVGDLGPDLTQQFLDRLDIWDLASETIVAAVEDPAQIPDSSELALRIGYHARWDAAEERAASTVYWVKGSDSTNDDFRRIARAEREMFPYRQVTQDRPLRLSSRASFRSIAARVDPDAVTTALDTMGAGVEALSAQLSKDPTITQAVESVIADLRSLLNVDAAVGDVLRYLPDDGSTSGLLRALQPALDLGDGAGHLQPERHGSTVTAQLATAEAMALAIGNGGVIAIDDFGDGLDTASARRLATLLRRNASQVWLTTRRPEVAASFDIEDLVRLTRSAGAPSRCAHQGGAPATRGERVAMRELHRQILPAMTARCLLIGEGPHDKAAYEALAERLDESGTLLPPDAHGARLIDAGSTDGGIDKVAHVARLGRDLGFRVVTLIDYDADEAQAATRLAAARATSDVVVRLPKGAAIEAALLDVPDADAVAALTELNGSYMLPLATGWQTLTGADLRKEAARTLKSNNGLHAQFVGALPNAMPSLATTALTVALDCARGVRPDTFVQL